MEGQGVQTQDRLQQNASNLLEEYKPSTTTGASSPGTGVSSSEVGASFPGTAESSSGIETSSSEAGKLPQ